MINRLERGTIGFQAAGRLTPDIPLPTHADMVCFHGGRNDPITNADWFKLEEEQEYRDLHLYVIERVLDRFGIRKTSAETVADSTEVYCGTSGEREYLQLVTTIPFHRPRAEYRAHGIVMPDSNGEVVVYENFHKDSMLAQLLRGNYRGQFMTGERKQRFDTTGVQLIGEAEIPNGITIDDAEWDPYCYEKSYADWFTSQLLKVSQGIVTADYRHRLRKTRMINAGPGVDLVNPKGVLSSILLLHEAKVPVSESYREVVEYTTQPVIPVSYYTIQMLWGLPEGVSDKILAYWEKTKT